VLKFVSLESVLAEICYLNLDLNISSAESVANQSEWQFNALPAKPLQTIEPIEDIRMQVVLGSRLKVFDTEQPHAKSAQGPTCGGGKEQRIVLKLRGYAVAQPQSHSFYS